MKLPKLFGKKAAPKEDLEDDELDDTPSTAVAKAPPDDDDDDDLGKEPVESPPRSRKPLLLTIATVSLVLVAIVGGGAWWLMERATSVGGPSQASAEQAIATLDIPPRPGGDAAAHPTTAQTATDTLNALSANGNGPGAGVVVAPVRPTAFADMTAPKSAKPLASAPDVALVEQGPLGPLPKVGTDGRKVWQVYARPFPAGDKRPRVAVIVGGLGMSREATEAAIRYLPGAVTLAFDPYGSGLPDWAAMARQTGHEVLLGLPMESADFPAHDPGPYALVTANSPADNLQRLDFLLSRFSGYVGVVTVMGSQFTLEDANMTPVLDALHNRGLLYVDAMTTRKTVGPATAQRIGMPRGFIDVRIDENPSRAAISERLSQLEELARRHGAAIAMAHPLPVTISRLTAWAASLEGRGLALAPVSAAVDRQPLR